MTEPTTEPTTASIVQEALDAGHRLLDKIGNPWTGDEDGVCYFCDRSRIKGHWRCPWLEFYEARKAAEAHVGTLAATNRALTEALRIRVQLWHDNHAGRRGYAELETCPDAFCVTGRPLLSGQPVQARDGCEHSWSRLPKGDVAWAEHDFVCSKCGAERDEDARDEELEPK